MRPPKRRAQIRGIRNTGRADGRQNDQRNRREAIQGRKKEERRPRDWVEYGEIVENTHREVPFFVPRAAAAPIYFDSCMTVKQSKDKVCLAPSHRGDSKLIASFTLKEMAPRAQQQP
ncbi:hypothetical protein KM043_009639 [Ampulex compressa]|nr:hypothetical protein KM043_009639 [Ampulex compressa]